MADRFPGNITLGGTIVIETVEQRERVETALSMFADACSHDYGEPSYGSILIEEIPGMLTDGYLVGKHDQARYGMFEEAEDALRKAGISYDRHSSASAEYDAEIVRWRPGMDLPDEQIATNNGDAQIGVDRVQKMIYDILFSKDETPYLDRIKNFEAAFMAETGQNVIALEIFKIIDNTPREYE